MRNLHEREIILMEKSFHSITGGQLFIMLQKFYLKRAVLYFIFLNSKANLKVFSWYLAQKGLTIHIFGDLGKCHV